jgi:hypothetical protein
VQIHWFGGKLGFKDSKISEIICNQSTTELLQFDASWIWEIARRRFEELYSLVFVVAANSRSWDITFDGNNNSLIPSWVLRSPGYHTEYCRGPVGVPGEAPNSQWEKLPTRELGRQKMN